MCWWRSCANGWGWKPVFTRFYRFSVLLFSRKRPFYGHFRPMTPNPIYSITLTNSSCSTYSRTAMFQNINLIEQFDPHLVAIFGGDHVYRMNVASMIDFHLAKQADVTVAAIPVPREQAAEFGVI